MSFSTNTRELVWFIILGLIITIPFLLLTIRAWAEFSLTRIMKNLKANGLTRREVRSRIKDMNPLPWELRLLLWLKYRENNSYHLENFMKQFSARKLGVAPEDKPTI